MSKVCMLTSTSVPFRPTTVQIPDLALTETKLHTVWTLPYSHIFLSFYVTGFQERERRLGTYRPQYILFSGNNFLKWWQTLDLSV